MKKIMSLFLASIIVFSSIFVVSLSAGAETLAESESNNDYSTADSLPLNSSVTGKMDSISDKDVYKITVSSNGKLDISFEHPYLDSTAYWRVMIYQYSNDKYNELSSLDVKGNGDETIEMPTIGAVSNDVYYVKIYMTASYYDLVDIEYRLITSFDRTDYYEKEVNDTYDTATNVSLNQTYSGTMNSISDIDMYKVTTSSNGKLSLSIEHSYLDSTAYWRVMIYQYSNGKYNELSSLEVKGNGDEIIEMPTIGAVSNGVYYVKIYMTASYYDLVGIEYRLKNSFDTTDYYEREVNDTYDTATNISLNQTYSGTMNSTSDIDMYKVTTSSNGKLSLSFKRPYLDSTAYWRVMIYQYSSGKYNELSSLDVKGNSDEIIEIPAIGAASNSVYYVKIYMTASYYDLVGAEYSIITCFSPDDNVKPTGSITSTNNISTSQTVTLKFSDNVGVAGYYWGTSSSYSNNSYVSTSSSSVTKTISTSGTYYLTVKDTSGNISTTYSITFYKTTLNSNGGSVSPTSILTKSGNTITLPTPTKSDSTFVGWGTSSSSTSGVKSITPTSNKTYYAIWEENPKFVLGDVNGDGIVDAADAGLISRYDAGFITLTSEQLELGDVNDDGVVDAGDAGIISRYDAGLITKIS